MLVKKEGGCEPGKGRAKDPARQKRIGLGEWTERGGTGAGTIEALCGCEREKRVRIARPTGFDLQSARTQSPGKDWE